MCTTHFLQLYISVDNVRTLGGKAILTEKSMHPPKFKTVSTQHSCRFQITDQITKTSLLRVDVQKWQQQNLHHPVFFQNVYKICWSRIKMISDKNVEPPEMFT